MAVAQKNSHLLQNSVWNASGFLVSVGLNLFVLPFVLFRLGAPVFGVAGLVTACIAPALTFSNALGLSTTRELARRLEPSERDDARRFFASALALAGVGGLPIAAVLSLVGPLLARRVFHLDGQVADDLTLAFLFGAGGCARVDVQQRARTLDDARARPPLEPSQRDAARRFFASALSLAGAGGLPIAALLSLLGPLLARRVFHLDGQVADDLTLAFLFGAGGWLCQCISAVFLALFTARQNYARLASISIVSTVVSTSSMLLLIPRWPQASTFLGCQALGLATGLMVSFALSGLVVREWVARPALHRGPLGGLVRLGGWQFAAQGGGLIAGQADRYLLGAFLAPQFVGYYTIAQRLEEAMYIGVLKIGEILFPFFSSLHKESTERIADLLFRSTWVLNLLAATLLGALIPVAGPLLYAWTGKEVAVETEGLLVVLAVAGMLGCASNVFGYYLLASGRSRSNALIALVTAVVTITTSAIALPAFGWQAAGLSACLGMIAQIVITMVLAAPDRQPGRRVAAHLSLCIAAAGNGHHHGYRIAPCRPGSTIRSSLALVVCRGLLCLRRRASSSSLSSPFRG